MEGHKIIELSGSEANAIIGFGHHAPIVVLTSALESMDILSAGTQIAGRGQLQRTASSLQFDNVLHTAFTPGPFTDDDRTIVILQARRHNLTGTCAVAIHQNCHLKVIEGPSLFRRPFSTWRVSAFRADDDTVLQKQVSNLHGRGEQATRIEPQVQHEALHAFFDEFVESHLQVTVSSATEGGEAYVSDL